MFCKILIANRGEIAVRLIRACRELGVRSVAVFSEVDRLAKHVQLADESFCLGDPKPSESYLNIPKIIKAAQSTGAEAIHPGYGFLSENANFAEACEKAKIVFIGPPASVIRQMGDKIGARNFLQKHKVPVVPGTSEPIQDLKEVRKRAGEIGYPVLLKAAAGGGGKGMKVVEKENELQEALESCQRVAKSAFGDDRIFMEKYLLSPRHVEFQIVADQQGNVLHLFERECSIQRRHQKIIEETPSPALDPGLRQKMGDVAVKIGKLIGYQSVGTIEFILDQEKNFYFLEVNTRLQVEHPVTEMVTGVDLVKTQIRIAAGEKLFLSPQSTGHAIECRICAEDPQSQFLPSIGKITKLQEPVGEGVRVDSGIFEGWEIPVEYDPMLSKLIVHAPTREKAILKMLQALDDYRVEGIQTNIDFLKDILRHPEFIAGRIETGFIGKFFPNWQPLPFAQEDPFSPWLSLSPIPSPSSQRRGDQGVRSRAKRHLTDHGLTSPMPGQVVKILVKEGDVVMRGAALVVIEAMKMEHSIFAPDNGTVKKIFHNVGDKVGMGDTLVEISH